jgi:hypothetical protein
MRTGAGIAFWSNQGIDLGIAGASWFSLVYDALILDGFLYIAGGFTEILGQARNHVAKVKMDDWTLDAWDPQLTGGDFGGCVMCLETDGSNIYLGGNFSQVGGVDRNRIAKVSVDGILSSWYPEMYFMDYINDLVLDGTYLWVCGGFTYVKDGGVWVAQEGLAAFDSSTAAWHSIRPQIAVGWAGSHWNPYVIDIADGHLICGGQFSQVKESGGTSWLSRDHLCAFDLSDGSLHAASPNPNGLVNAFHGDMSNLIVGGAFTAIYGVARSYLASVDLAGDSVDTSYPQSDGRIDTTATDGTYDYVSGEQTTIGGQSRLNTARIDHWGRAVDPTWLPPYQYAKTYYENTVILPVTDPAGPMVIAPGQPWEAGIPEGLCMLDSVTGNLL